MSDIESIRPLTKDEIDVWEYAALDTTSATFVLPTRTLLRFIKKPLRRTRGRNIEECAKIADTHYKDDDPGAAIRALSLTPEHKKGQA